MKIINPKKPLKTILMLDNNKRLLEAEATKKYFLNINVEFIIVHKFTVAWAKLRTKSPDCIIIDITKTNHGLYDFTNKLKRNLRFQHIPVIFVTPKGLVEDRIKYYTVGCNAYITKPFALEELNSVVVNLVFHKELWMSFLSRTYTLLKELKLIIIEKSNRLLLPPLTLYLTPREILVLKNLVAGKTHREISIDLNTTLRNVEICITKLLDKTKTQNVNELRRLPWSIIRIFSTANDGN